MTTLIFCGGVQNVVVENVSANQSILDFLLIVGHIKFPMVQKVTTIHVYIYIYILVTTLQKIFLQCFMKPNGRKQILICLKSDNKLNLSRTCLEYYSMRYKY